MKWNKTPEKCPYTKTKLILLSLELMEVHQKKYPISQMFWILFQAKCHICWNLGKFHFRCNSKLNIAVLSPTQASHRFFKTSVFSSGRNETHFSHSCLFALLYFQGKYGEHIAFLLFLNTGWLKRTTLVRWLTFCHVQLIVITSGRSAGVPDRTLALCRGRIVP